ncbi:MAG TPA: hypothetical protein VH592_24895 [Gemmataceae bacterium]|jgi:hypothetical protein
MRKVLFSPTFVVLALTLGCQNSPPSAPNPAADAGNPGLFSRLFASNSPKAPNSTATTKGADKGPNGVALGKKTKQDLGIENVMKRQGMVRVEFDGLNKYVDFADLHGFRNAVAALESLAPLSLLREANLHNTSVNDADLVNLQGLHHLQNLNLSSTKVTDAGLKVLQSIPSLSVLNLNETQVTDGGLQYLRGLPNLTDLSLYGTKVTDEGLAQFRNSQSLHKLVLGGSQSITDRTLLSLREMPQLREVTILSSRVTESAIEDLKVASTQLKVIH